MLSDILFSLMVAILMAIIYLLGQKLLQKYLDHHINKTFEALNNLRGVPQLVKRLEEYESQITHLGVENRLQQEENERLQSQYDYLFQQNSLLKQQLTQLEQAREKIQILEQTIIQLETSLAEVESKSKSTLKICSQCGYKRRKNSFLVDHTQADGLSPYCKFCSEKAPL